MQLPIIIYGSSVLRKKSFNIDTGDDFNQMALNMAQTLKKAGGIGLAGPQVDLLKSMFVIDTTPLESEGFEPVEKVYINPQILNYDDSNTYFNEGCLSIPGIFENVNRPEKVEVRFRDRNFDWHEETLDGIVSRIFQHEYDHLQGILFVDRLSIIRKKLIKSKLKQLTRKKHITV